jgi:hypothetical protein
MGKWAGVTPYMFFCCAVFSFGNILYGLLVQPCVSMSRGLTHSDVSSFGAIQTLPSWLNEFGEEINGQHVLGTKRKLIMNSGELDVRAKPSALTSQPYGLAGSWVRYCSSRWSCGWV